MRRVCLVGASVMLALLVLGVHRPAWLEGERARGIAPSGRNAGKLVQGVANRGGTLRLEEFDPAELRAAHPVRKGAPLRFAEAVDVAMGPDTHGTWRSDGGEAVWTLRVEAPGSLNLNFGFERFVLPAGAALEFRGAEGELLVRPFTAADHDAHGELWTPVLAGDTVDLVLTVAAQERAAVDLKLGAINRGFRELRVASAPRKVGSNAPAGDCHIDVVCSAEDSGIGDAIDLYRDQIRSAALYTLGGIDACSGGAVNNARHDGRPYFLTADHCGVRSFNAASMVVYWNFENETCRMPGSAAAGMAGDGLLTDFNSGAIFRATSSSADTTLVELDDPIDPAHAVYLAGWSREGSPSMGVTVHHPALSEKRISFDFDALQSTDDSSSTTNPSGAFWRVIDWEFGSTEGGSSGSPLFDETGRIVGLLSGGFAACGNDESDWYSKFARAWTGGGTPDSRLSTWLDPDGTGMASIDGLDLAAPSVTIGDAEAIEGDSGTADLRFAVALSQPAEERVELSWSTQDDTALGGEDYQIVTDGSLAFEAGETEKEIAVAVIGDDAAEENERFRVILALSGSAAVVLSDGEAAGTILNDDYIPPVVVGPATVNGSVAQDVTAVVEAQNTPTQFSLSEAPAGMTIDSAGTIRWLPALAGSFMVTVTASNPAGSDTFDITFEIEANPLASALDVAGAVSIATGGAEPWISSSSPAGIFGGSLGASGMIADEESSWLEVTVEGPDYLGFWWKVSSESEYDFLHLDVDGERRASISGLLDWAYKVVALPPGVHRVRWTYEKDNTISEGGDRGWVDFVQLASSSAPFLMEPPRVMATLGGPVDYRFPVFRSGAGFEAAGLPGDLTLSGEGELTGSLAPSGRHDFELSVAQDGREVTVPATVEVHPSTPLGVALGQPALVWLLEGTAADGWLSQLEVSRDGLAAAVDSVEDEGYAEVAAHVTGPGEVSFWWKVSSEENYDGLVFEIDGVFRDWISGEVDWARRTFALPYGRHRLSWYYVKDGFGADGLDTGWIDQVEFAGYTGWVLAAGVGRRTNLILDPDRDEQSLLFEYATGGSAAAWDAMPAVCLTEGVLECSIDKPAGLMGVAFDAEVSSDLADWSRTGRTILQDDEAAFRVRDAGDQGEERRFMRVTVHPER